MITTIKNKEGVRISSRDIADKTGKLHKHVLRDIKKMFADLDYTDEFNESKFGLIYFDDRNREQVEYMLDRKHTDCLIMGYDVKRRMAVLDYIEQLENELALSKREKPKGYVEGRVSTLPEHKGFNQMAACQCGCMGMPKTAEQQARYWAELRRMKENSE
ncbi:MAG: Rha family transcriptional regulator [Akkermansiaceae bacterium]